MTDEQASLDRSQPASRRDDGSARLPRRAVLKLTAGTAVGLGTLASGAEPASGRPSRRHLTTTAASQQTKLAAADGDESDFFGWSVSVSGDGTTAIIGAPNDDDRGEGRQGGAGSAYVFARDGEAWTQQTKLTAGDGDAEDGFGTSAAVSDDGTTAIIGAKYDEDPNGERAGSAYVFGHDGETWTQQAKLTAADGSSGDGFGWTVSVSGDGGTAIVGAIADNNPNGTAAGAAYVFDRAGGDWPQRTTLTADDGDAKDGFGSAVSVSRDGTTAVVGALNDEDPNGQTSDGIGAGSAYVFGREGETWTQQTKLAAADGTPRDGFGHGASISDDGTTAIIGATREAAGGAGSAYVFGREGETWTQQAKLVPEEGIGFSVAMAGDGTTTLVGALSSDFETAGAAYVFDRTGSDWGQRTKLTPDDGDAGDQFGISAALSGDGTTGLIGASNDEDPNGRGAGAAYVFSLQSTPATQSFDPADHGFGFANYTTGDHPDFEEIYNVVQAEFEPRLEEIGLDTALPGFTTTLATAVYTIMDGGLTNGHCLGMVHTARRYFRNGVPRLPEYDRTVRTAADIEDPPETTPALDPVEHDIDTIQHTQALTPHVALRYLAEVFAPSSGVGSIDHAAILDTIDQRVAAGNTTSLSLVDTAGGIYNSFITGHQVLAYDVTRLSETRATVAVYDPNLPALEQDRLNDIRFTRPSSDDDFDVTYTNDTGTYDRAMSFDEAPSGGFGFFQDGETTDGYKSALAAGLKKYISIGVKSPVSLTVTTPDGRTVPAADIPPEPLRRMTGYDALHTGFGTGAGQYDITVTGTGSGEFEVVVKGSDAEGGSISDSISGDISAGETRTLAATLPASPAEQGEVTSVSDGDTIHPPDVTNDGHSARDPDGDGLYEDVNGDGEATPGDATVLFDNVFEGDSAVMDNVSLFDFNGDNTLTPGDATVLFDEIF